MDTELWVLSGERNAFSAIAVAAPNCATADVLTKIAALDPSSPLLTRHNTAVKFQ